jgi:hypothetical protein
MSIQWNMSQVGQRRHSDRPEFTSRTKGFPHSSRAAQGIPPEAPGSVCASVSRSCSSSSDLERSLLAEIDRLGGEERSRGAKGALDMFHASLSELVAQNPKEYGAGDDPESQRRVVSHLIESVKTPFLARTVAGLRQRAGYVLVCGYWIHRAVFTFVGFGLLAAVALPLCAVSLMSTRAWGWLPGALGLVATLGAGAWILSRIRDR